MAAQNQESFASGVDVGSELLVVLRDRLTDISIKCSERCLYQSAKWAAELLNSLPEEDADDDSFMHNTDTTSHSSRIFTSTQDDPVEASLEIKEGPKYLLAKAYFDTKEFDRCAAVFLPPAIPAGGLAIFEKSKGRTPTSTPSRQKSKNKQDNPAVAPFPLLSQKSLFLSLYARYLAGEKRRDEETETVLGPADGGQTTNRELPGLARGLETYFKGRDAADPLLKRSQGWLEYLYGVVLIRSRQEELAQKWLLRSVRLNPYHWGAWEELAALLASADDLNAQLTSSGLQQNIMSLLYETYALVELSSTTDAPTTNKYLNTLLQIFPQSTFVMTQQALLYYHNKDNESAASIFQDLLITHPHRLDALDHYSNILYVMTDRPKLAFLAHLATTVDKFRPETCCVVGNYYSLCSQHEKAVMYFRRALTLDRNFLSAWTLMGHEYIELKNTHAAIESYRRAVDVNRKDYRAWYGLGQAYEVLDMGYYALYYYQRAAGLRPYDAKMWQAVGSCYAKMDRNESAIKALKRALVASTYFEPESPQSSFNPSTSRSSNPPKPSAKSRQTTGRKLLDPETLFQIASLYERTGNENEAAQYMDLCVAQETGSSSKSVAAAEKALRKRQQKETELASLQEARRQHRQAQSMTASGDDLGDGDTEILSSNESEPDSVDGGTGGADDDDGNDESVVDDGFGTGTTATTSKARLWLARWARRQGDLDRAERFAEELCVDGYEVEEAKGLLREVRGKRDGLG